MQGEPGSDVGKEAAQIEQTSPNGARKRLSAFGVGAMQGLKAADSATPTNDGEASPADRRQDQPTAETGPADQKEIIAAKGENWEPALDRGEVRSATSRADGVVRIPSELTETKIAAYESKIQGQIGEEAMEQRGAETLNDYRHNFPVYDAVMPGETASIKTHMPSDEHPNAYLANYAHDLAWLSARPRPRAANMPE